MAITNHLNLTFNFESIDTAFDFFKISTSDKYISKGAYLLDKPINNLKALSISFDYGRSAFVMFNKNTITSHTLSEQLGDEKLSFTKVYSSQIQSYILARLFLYSLANYYSEENQFNNLTGKLYLTNSAWNRKNLKNIIALGIDIDKDLYLQANATTFTKFSIFKKNKEVLKGNYPKYVLENTLKLRRVLSSDETDNIYIKKGIPGVKCEIPFLVLKPNEIRNSRAYFIDKIIKIVNERYTNYLRFEFTNLPLTKTMVEKSDTDFIEKSLNDVRNSKVVLINKETDSLYESSFLSLKESLSQKLGTEIAVSNDISPNSLNIIFLHDKDYYSNKKIEDPYQQIKRNEVIQCVTIEDSVNKIINNTDAVINTIFKELTIKNDIVHKKRITLDRWENFGFKNDWYFGIEKDEIKYFMTIHPDGTFQFEKSKPLFSTFSSPNIRSLANLIDDSNLKGKSIIMDESGNVIMLSRTGEYCLPNPEIYKLDVISRSNDSRKALLEGIVDICFYEKDNQHYYSSGMVGKGMNTGIPKASLIYKVDLLKGQNILESLLKTMSVAFVKYNSFTVLPYPFKYLREYIEMDEANNTKTFNKK